MILRKTSTVQAHTNHFGSMRRFRRTECAETACFLPYFFPVAAYLFPVFQSFLMILISCEDSKYFPIQLFHSIRKNLFIFVCFANLEKII
jgi:hypothetical protein